MSAYEYVTLPSGEEVLKIPRQDLDNIVDNTREILWELIQCMGDSDRKFVYTNMMAITLHHYRRIQQLNDRGT